MKIAILEEKTVTGGGEVTFDEICALGETVRFPLTPQDKIVERVKDCDAAIINKTVFTREIMESCPRLKYIGLCATGCNNVDLTAAAEFGITVTNCPSYSTDAVAQQVFAYILYFMNRIADYNADVHKGGWIASDTFSYFPFPTYELCGKTIGIIGFGSIGRRVSEIALAFGMKVLAFTRSPKQAEGVVFTELDNLLKESDIITLHCPLTKDTRYLIRSETIALCKKSAVIINTSRGDTVNEKDLAEALNSSRIAAAAVDVISAEPMEKDNPLMYAPNCIITPHTSWTPVQTRQRLMKLAAENLRAFIEGHPINKVN